MGCHFRVSIYENGRYRQVLTETETRAGDWLVDATGRDFFNPNPDYDSALDIQMSATSAGEVLTALGFTGDIWNDRGFFSEPLSLVLDRCATWLAENGIDKALPATAETNGQFTMVDCGRPVGYLRDKIRRIEALGFVGVERGANRLTAG